jgi:hypothetical protein
MGKVCAAAFEDNPERYLKRIESAFIDVEDLIRGLLSTVKDEDRWAAVKEHLDRQSDIRRGLLSIMGHAGR